jgi:hypothetical protein
MTASIADTQDSISLIIENLSKPIPPRLLATREQSGTTLTYIPWFNCVKLLNHYCIWEYDLSFGQLGVQRYEEKVKKGWQGKPDTIKTVQLGASVILKASVTIYCREGQLTRSAIGEELLESDAHGGPAKTAESEVLRRAASKFGLGLYLYDPNAR